MCLIRFDSTIPKRSSGETFLSQSRCLRSCGSRCCSPGRFRDRGLVVAVAAKGNKHAKTHKKCWERSWPYLVGKTESSQKQSENPETGIGGEWWWMIMTMMGHLGPRNFQAKDLSMTWDIFRCLKFGMSKITIANTYTLCMYFAHL